MTRGFTSAIETAPSGFWRSGATTSSPASRAAIVSTAGPANRRAIGPCGRTARRNAGEKAASGTRLPVMTEESVTGFVVTRLWMGPVSWSSGPGARLVDRAGVDVRVDGPGQLGLRQCLVGLAGAGQLIPGRGHELLLVVLHHQGTQARGHAVARIEVAGPPASRWPGCQTASRTSCRRPAGR